MTSRTSDEAKKSYKSSKHYVEGKCKVKEEKAPTPGYGNYWRILSFGARFEHVLLLVGSCSAAASGAALPLMTIVFGTLLGSFNSYDSDNSPFTEESFKQSLSRQALYFVYLFIAKFGLAYIGLFCFKIVGLRISAALRLAYLKALFSQPIKKLDEVSTGTVANTITLSANDIQAGISDRLSGLFQSLALIVAAYAIAFKYSWALTLAVSAGILFVIITLAISTPFVLKGLKDVQKADEQHTTVTSETFSSIRTILSLGAEQRMIDKHSVGVLASHRASKKLKKWFAVHLSPFYFTTYACYALAFWLGLKLYREGKIDSVANVIIVFFSVLLVTAVMGQVAQPIMAINKAITASSGFFDMIDSEQVRTEGLKDPDVSAYEDLELRHVTFAYPTRSTIHVLKSFSAVIRRGKTTALVGPSGSGKSTIVGLLERWYSLQDESTRRTVKVTAQALDKELSPSDEKAQGDDPIEITGSITIGGRDINDTNLKWWRAQIGLVQQEPFLFHDTIANNVAHGLIGTKWEDSNDDRKLQLVKEACIEAFAEGFINKLPQGYQTKVGEGGIKLSGGQRQRIAIARSIVRKPAILILDEATSAIDVHGEKLVQAALDRAAQNRTTIMIAHRLSTIRKADHIIVLRNGEKVEEGTHTGLLSMENGLYSALVRAQKIEEQGDTQTGIKDEQSALKPELTRVSTHQSQDEASGNENAHLEEKEEKEEGAASRGTYKRQSLRACVVTIMRDQRSKSIFVAITIAAAMACGAAYALQSWLFAQLIHTFEYTGQQLIDRGNFWSLMFFILAIWVAIAYWILTMAAGTFSVIVGTSCRQTYFSSALKMPVAYFDQDENTSGSVMQRLSGDPKAVQDLLGVQSSFPLISIFNVLGCAIISFYFGWKLTLVVFFAVMPVIVGASFLRTRYEVEFDANNAKVFSTSSQFATEATGAFRTVSSLGMENAVIKRYDVLLADQIKTSTRRASYAMLLLAFTDSVELCGMALAFWYGGQLLASGELSAFSFFVIYSAIVQGAQAAGQYMSIIPNVASATASANRILELRSKTKDQDQLQKQAMAADAGSGVEIVFNDVSFKYASLSTPLFTHLNINIKAGQFVAFVGPSGCGKTTTISMLERFYDPVAGSICVDGENIATLEVRSYRDKLALVSQEPRLFSGTLKENLLLSIDASKVSEEQMIQACRDAEIHDFIMSLPDGYGTHLGTNAQTTLSGGQKQRVCLARALLRKPKLLLLDEATSSLDSQSEKLVQGAIERLAGQRSMTVVAVAHRLATIQKADVIFVFGERDTESVRGSRIVERGSHSDLIAKRGVYWSMCKGQALDR